MSKNARFKIDPRLATLLGENYRSTEQALKELIDNAWDADALNVKIRLPTPMTKSPIIVEDDGLGMTSSEVTGNYLRIARDRRSRSGDFTSKGRRVKGRKGIGKFAGLVIADTMSVETTARGKITKIEITRNLLVSADCDLEKIDLPTTSSECSKQEHGTKITLADLNDRFNFPNAEALKSLLAIDYGRQQGFQITVNDEPVTTEDISGASFNEAKTLNEAGNVKYNFKIPDSSKPIKQPGIALRVSGKIVGKPSFFGLEEDESIPLKLLKRVVGEIEADELEDEVTADWSSLIENGKGRTEVRAFMQEKIKAALVGVFNSEMNLAKARYAKLTKERLSQMPEHRRQFAQDGIEKILAKFFDESDEKKDVLISLMLEALEKDEYWTVCKKVESAKNQDVKNFADALDSFGLADLAVIGCQARARLKFLDGLDELASNVKTLEAQMHKALETNLWVLGIEYSLMKSNVTLKKIVEEYSDKKFTGNRANKRPDLILNQSIANEKLLIEFKRPSEVVGRDAEAQAKKYRDDLTSVIGHMAIIIIGGAVDSKMSAEYAEDKTKFISYKAIISRARTELDWLIRDLS